MINNKIKILLLTTIVIISVFLRFWRLDIYPALNADEAAIGYNAYSLIETGRDEHGNPWPIHFQSFNDFKPGLYFYIVLPFVKFFGLNTWSVRIPNAIFGVLTVLLMYFLSKELFGKKDAAKAEKIGITAAFMLASSPWHIHFSRGGWEVNTASFLITAGIYFFLKYKNNLVLINLILAGISFVLSLYAYHAARVIVPLVGFGFIFIYAKFIKTNFSKILVVGLLCFMLLIPLIGDLMKGQVSSRAVGVGLFADPGPLSRVNEQRGEHDNYSGLTAKVYHNKLINYGLAFLDNWADHYHGDFLFLSGDVIERNKVPETGQAYMIDLLWFLIGLVWLIRVKTKNTKVILWWFIVAPTAAALTFQSPHSLRAQNMVIPLVIISACGLVSLLEWLSKRSLWLTRIGSFFVGLIIVLGFIRYQHMYWVHMAKEYKFSSQYGVKELVDFIKDDGAEYQKVLVTDRYDQPYILFLFYLKYPPKVFQQNHVLLGRDRYGFSTVPAFDKYEFSSINFDRDRPKYPNYLIAGTGEEIPREANIIKQIYGSNGHLYFEVVAN